MGRQDQTEFSFPLEKVTVLDGGLSTHLPPTLLNTPLWSASLLSASPSTISHVHKRYYDAGAQVATTASYQASTRGLVEQLGISDNEASELLIRSVKLAQEARDQARGETNGEIFVTGSVGPFGAYLGDGAEYTGTYPSHRLRAVQSETSYPSRDTLEVEEVLQETEFIRLLSAFHAPRLNALVCAEPDLLAFETIPNFLEAQALMQLLQQHPFARAWMTFSLRDASHLPDGTPLDVAVRHILQHDRVQIVGVGVNCVPLSLVSEAIRIVAKVVEEQRRSDVAIVVYPNSGEVWDAASKTWGKGEMRDGELSVLVEQWIELGARVIGGCCRMGVEEVRCIAEVASRHNAAVDMEIRTKMI